MSKFLLTRHKIDRCMIEMYFYGHRNQQLLAAAMHEDCLDGELLERIDRDDEVPVAIEMAGEI